MATMIAKALLEKDRRSFFAIIQDQNVSIFDLVEFYISYLGPIFGDQKTYFKQRFNLFLNENGLDSDRYELLLPNGVINPDFLRKFFPTLASRYFRPSNTESLIKLELLSGSENEFRNTDLPVALNQRSWRPSRAPLVAYLRMGGSLFVSPHGYQYFDEDLRCFWPHASTRSYSEAVTALPRRCVAGVVILIQDAGDGTNFAHFTFDWVTRIVHILALGLIDKANTTFVMGGDRTEYHNVILGRLQNVYNISDEQFYFPQQREILNVDGPFVFFSDQVLWPLHPAQMAHPRSMRILTEIAKGISHSDVCGPKRIFISRGDASLRKISNEEELIKIAIEFGFTVVCMADFSALEQINLIRGARVLVGAHGMGFTHIIFNDGPLAIMELFHPELGTDAYSLIARALKFAYDYVIGSKIDDNKGSYHIDTEIFRVKMIKTVKIYV